MRQSNGYGENVTFAAGVVGSEVYVLSLYEECNTDYADELSDLEDP